MLKFAVLKFAVLLGCAVLLPCLSTFGDDFSLTDQAENATQLNEPIVNEQVSENVLDIEPFVIEEVSLDPVQASLPEPISIATAESIEIDSDSKKTTVEFGDWLGYNPTQSDTTWLAGRDFGMFSMEDYPTLPLGTESSVILGTGFHFLNGPAPPDMPPRLFDFQLAFQTRKQLSPRHMLDVKLGFGVFSDFQGSARKGVRFPGHIVHYIESSRNLATVLGLEFLDRDDITLLPVAGFVWRPHDDIVLEMVFPKPRVQLRLNPTSAMYVSGELGGGTWAVKRDPGLPLSSRNDNATYSDIRVLWGVAEFDDESETSWEIGWAFDRSMRYRSGVGDSDFDGAFLMRWRKHF